MYLTHDSEEAKELLQETAVTVLANATNITTMASSQRAYARL